MTDKSGSSSDKPRRWRVRDEQGDDLITYWRSFPPPSNEVAAADIIEELERELAEAITLGKMAADNCDEALERAEEAVRQRDAALSAPSAGASITPPDAPTVEEIEEFRRENIIQAHLGETPQAGLEPWAIQSNRILNYLCHRACTPLSAREASDGVLIPERYVRHLADAMDDAPLTKKCKVCQEVRDLLRPVG